MAQCQSPEELMSVISRIVDAMVNQYLLCGTLQGGLVACGESARLPKDTEIVLCRQLAELVQAGIDAGTIVAPTVVDVRYEGSTLILHLADESDLSLDLKPLVDNVIDQAFIDCNGQAIHVGTALATCVDLTTVQTALQTNINTLTATVASNRALSEQADNALDTRIDDHQTAVAMQIDALDTRIDDHQTAVATQITALQTSLGTQIDAAVQEWANGVLQNLITLFLDTRQVYHDESLTGDGHEASPLSVDATWLAGQIATLLPTLIQFTDCCGNAITPTSVLVTCACLEQQLTQLANELQAYAESQDALTLADANAYTDAAITQLITDLPTLVANAGFLQTVATDQSLSGDGTVGDPLHVAVSPDNGNLLQERANGLYYGIEAPADLSNLYVDSLLGDDTNAGTEVAPFLTLNKALSLVDGTLNQTIRLKAGDDRPDYVLDSEKAMTAGMLTIMAYGDTYIDGAIYTQKMAERTAACLYYNGYRAVDVQRPRIVPTMSYNNTFEHINVPSLSARNGAKIRWVAVEFKLVQMRDPARPWIFTSNSFHYTEPYGIVDAENCIFTDELPDPIADGNQILTQFIAGSMWLGRPSLTLRDCHLNIPNRTATIYNPIFYSLFALNFYESLPISACMGVTQMVDQIGPILQADPDSLLYYNIVDVNGLILQPTTNKPMNPDITP